MQSTPIRHRRPEFRHGMRSRQRGYGEDLFLAVIVGYPLLALLITAIAIAFALKMGESKKIKLVLLCIVVAVLYPLWKPIFNTMNEVDSIRAENRQWDAIRVKSLEVCKKDVELLPETVPVDSVVDETGGLRAGDIEYLLVTKRLSFVEVKLGIKKGLIAIDENTSWPTSQDDGYAHLELGPSSSPNCYFPGANSKEYFFSNRAPVKPGTCLQVTYLATSSSGNSLTEMPSNMDSRLSYWAVVDRQKGITTAGVTDAFRNRGSPQTTPRWDRRGGSKNLCESGLSGFGLLLDRLIGTNDSIAATNQWVLNERSINVRDMPRTIEAVKMLRDSGRLSTLSFSDGPFIGTRESLRDRSTWAEAYASSIKYGALVHENQLIFPSENSLYRIQNEGLNEKWGSTGTQLILVRSMGDISHVAIFGVSFQGKLLWSGEIEPTNIWLGFGTERFEIAGSELLVHGINVRGNNDSPPWTIRLSLSELNELQKSSNIKNQLAGDVHREQSH